MRIGQPQFLNSLLRAKDGLLSDIEANELTAGDGIRHWDEVCAFIASDFEHAATINRRRGQAVKNPHNGKAVGVSVRIGKAGIGNQIVRLWCIAQAELLGADPVPRTSYS